MKGCAPALTKADRVRFDLLSRLGCVACRLNGCMGVALPEMHHISQRDNQATIPLCAWHHRGEPRGDLRPSACEIVLGPSLARSKRYFQSHYGSEKHLLDYTNQLLLEIQ